MRERDRQRQRETETERESGWNMIGSATDLPVTYNDVDTTLFQG